MKPPAFEYHAPATVEDALRLLGTLGPDAKALAGGQSLVPMMNFRISHPTHLVDLNNIPGLSGIKIDGDDLRIGAMTRHRDVEHSGLIKKSWPLLSGVMKHVAHVQIRSRGTIGGSLCHADPSAELPAVMGALEGEFVLQRGTETRVVPARDFFVSALTTVLEPDELLVEIRIPSLPAGTSWAFDELSRRRGDFAIVGVAAVVRCDRTGAIDFVRISFTGVGETFIRAVRAEEAILGRKPTPEAVAEVARIAASGLDPPSDIHASSSYRTRVSEVMAERVLSLAIERQKALAA